MNKEESKFKFWSFHYFQLPLFLLPHSTMCMFTEVVSKVRNTRIFVAGLKDGNQFTVYQNFVAFSKDAPRVAMILPFPNPNGTITRNSQIVVPMNDYKDFFARFHGKFCKANHKRGGSSKPPAPKPLPVFRCGGYDYSVVPSLEDLAALQFETFKLRPCSTKLLDTLKRHYATGYGFLICIYVEEGEIPPIAFVHPKLATRQLFVPTMHDHHGDDGYKHYHQADWDHDIYILNNATPTHYSLVLINPTKPFARVAIKDSILRDGYNLPDLFDYTKLPAGFPVGEELQDIVLVQIHGNQPNGDLAFISSCEIAKCQKEGKCTFDLTDKTDVIQSAVHCRDCCPSEAIDLCMVCAEKCKRLGHRIYMYSHPIRMHCHSYLVPKILPRAGDFRLQIEDQVD